jgi:hypothetical protein
MNYLYKVETIYGSHEVANKLDEYSKHGWRLHSVVHVSESGGLSGSIKQEDLNHGKIELNPTYGAGETLLIFEKKEVIQEVKDIMNGED